MDLIQFHFMANEFMFKLFLPFPSWKYLTALKAPTVLNNASLFLSINSFWGLHKINVSYAMTLFVVFLPDHTGLHSIASPLHPVNPDHKSSTPHTALCIRHTTHFIITLHTFSVP